MSNPQLSEDAYATVDAIASLGDRVTGIFQGITLRDVFATAALIGILANHDTETGKATCISMKAYAIAEAMIKERRCHE